MPKTTKEVKKSAKNAVKTSDLARPTAPITIKIWGARGSLPSPLSPPAVEEEFRSLFDAFFEQGFKSKKDISKFISSLPKHRLGGFGGNTLCVEVNSPKQQLIIDAGSGIRLLGYEMMQGPCGRGTGEAHILFTHFHWDHLVGLPFFTPLFIPGNKIHVYAVQDNLPEVFKVLFKKPYFPVSLEQLPAKIEYHRLTPREAKMFSDLKVTPYQLDHPDPCWGFRFENSEKVYSHCVDTECKRVSRAQLGPDLPLYQNVDLMVFDAQYTLVETLEKVDWGHAAASMGIDLAIREGIKKVLFVHNDPASSNEKIAAAEAQARRYYEAEIKSSKKSNLPFHEVDWAFAQEGDTYELR